MLAKGFWLNSKCTNSHRIKDTVFSVWKKFFNIFGENIPTNYLCFIICHIISLNCKPNVSGIYTEIQNYNLQHEIYTLKIYGGNIWFLVQNIKCLEVATLP